MEIFNRVFLHKAVRVGLRKADALVGRLYSIQRTLDKMSIRPYELHLELTNVCNANCVFCPYQFQKREFVVMQDEVFHKAVGDYVSSGGGSVGLTPIVGDALIDPKFLDRVRYLRSQPKIDRIWLTTNAILLDKHGIKDVLEVGLSSITISTSGFDEATYERIYRSKAYQRVRNNVLALLEENAKRPNPIPIAIGLRSDRPLTEVIADPDFQQILAYKPEIDFTWSYTSANGRITEEILPPGMRLRVVNDRKESCVQTFNGPMVLADGTVMACSCVASVDGAEDLGIGNVMDANLAAIWTGEKVKKLRASFGTNQLNPTCSGCDMYRDLEMYRTSEGRTRAKLNLARYNGVNAKNRSKPKGSFSGG